MPSGTGLDLFGEAFPSRIFDVGIAEQHAVTFAAGLASEGFKPFAAIYSTFLQRAYDQVVHDVAIQKLPVRFPIDRAGFVGADGPTHCGAFDTTYLATLPGFVVMAAADEAELRHMVRTAAAYDEGPIAFRYPRGNGVGVDMPERGQMLEIGKGRIVKEGTKVALLSLRHAAAGLPRRRRGTRRRRAFDDRRRRPLRQAARPGSGAPAGPRARGAGDGRGRRGRRLRQPMCCNSWRMKGLLDSGLKVRPLVLPDIFIEQAKPEKMYADAGLDTRRHRPHGLCRAGQRGARRAAPRADRFASRFIVLW